ncbi:MAG: phosphonate ABC transporter substrate-binding protein [Alphaproteobacteria bacterium]|nr:phosphonate ABC transporter substrate-binding protein [Alphaproteobacteria bacterium]
MMNRRKFLTATAAAAGTAVLAAPARAEGWQAKLPELVFSAIPAENASGLTDRYQPFMNYLAKELGTKVTLRIANDYAALIEGQRTGNIHIGYYGPASFARALLTGVKTSAFVMDVNSDGSKGYYSVFYVKKDSPYKTIEDLKGKVMGFVDPNSTSGYNMPMFKLNSMNIDADKFFGKTIMTGSHENAVLALAQGTVDVCANSWNSDDDSNLTRMLNKGMLKNADGSPMKKEDFRIILKSDLIINGPTAYLDSLPDDAKAAIKKAFLEAATKDKAAFDKLSDGKNKPWAEASNKDYDKTVELIKFVDNLKKKTG